MIRPPRPSLPVFVPCIAALCLVAGQAPAAPPPHLWSQRFGSAYNEFARAVAVDGSGNVFVAGTFEGTVDFGGGPLGSAGRGDIFVAKYDADGVHQWSLGFGGEHTDLGHSIAVDGSGDVVVTGSFAGTVDFGGGPQVSDAGSDDIFVAKFGADGSHRWSQRFGDDGADLGRSIAVDPAGDVIVTGDFEGVVNFGGSNLVSAGGNDIFVAAFNAAGEHQWSRRSGNIDGDWGIGVTADRWGNVVVTGEFNGWVDFGGGGLESAGRDDMFLAKYSQSGEHRWSRRYGGTGYDGGHMVAVDDSGNVFVTGEMDETVNFGGGDLVSAGEQDIFVARFSAGGDHRWSRRFGDDGLDRGHSVAVDDSGNVVVAGYFAGTVDFGGGALESVAGSDDIFLAKYDANGSHRWSQRFGSDASDLGYSVALDGWGNLVLTGYIGGTVNFGGADLAGAGGTDVFIAKFGPGETNGFGGGPPRAAPSISAFPNPFNPATTIRYTVPSNGRVELAVFDARGTRVALLVDAERSAGTYEFAWSGRDDMGRVVGSGVYFARVRGATGSRSCKLVLLK